MITKLQENKAAQIVSVAIVFSRVYVQMSLIDVIALFIFYLIRALAFTLEISDNHWLDRK